jgi:hypothetical protein
MKKVSKLLYAFMFVLVAVLTSCDKDVETSSLTVDNFPKATITGYVYASLDLTNYGDETAPEGTEVIITIPYSDFEGLGNSSGNYMVTTKLDANGSFTIEVPADADGVSVTAKTVNFVYDQVQAYSSQQTTVSKKYPSATLSFSVKSNDVQVQRVTVGDPEAIVDPENVYTLKGYVYAAINDTTSATELVTNQSIIFYTTGWNKTITTGADGSYTISNVPEATISIDYKFDVSGYTSAKKKVTWNFDGYQTLKSVSADDGDYTITLSSSNRTQVTE